MAILTLGCLILAVFSFIRGHGGIIGCDVRLRGGAANSGRIEVRYKYTWWTVCIDGFNNDKADVVCRQLGFRGGALRVDPMDDFSFTSVDTSLDIIRFNASCAGDENNIRDCPDVRWSEGTCQSNRPAAVFCALPYYEGCFESDSAGGIADNSRTLEDLIGLCRIFQYAYAGSSQEGGDKSRCGNNLSDFGTLVEHSLCTEVCVNDLFQLCGGTRNYRVVYSTRLGSEGFSLTGNSGSLTSYNYPGVYVSNNRQEWTVTPDFRQRVQISFPAFDISAGDVITISAGGMNETFTTRRTWISDLILSFTVWFESASPGNGFILNYDVYNTPTTVVASTTHDTPTTQPPTTDAVTPSPDTTTTDLTTPMTNTTSQPPPSSSMTTLEQPTIVDETTSPASFAAAVGGGVAAAGVLLISIVVAITVCRYKYTPKQHQNQEQYLQDMRDSKMAPPVYESTIEGFYEQTGALGNDTLYMNVENDLENKKQKEVQHKERTADTGYVNIAENPQVLEHESNYEVMAQVSSYENMTVE